MRWIYLSLAGALSFSGASASVNAILGAKFNMDVGASQYISEMAHAAPKKVGRRNNTTANPFLRFLQHLEARQNTGRCGADFGGQSCTDNQCCSQYGYCGTDFEYCGEIVGCQPQYGRCGNNPVSSSSPTPTPTPTPTPSSSIPTSTLVVPSSSTVSPPLPSGTLVISTNGACGNSTTCAGSPFGNCCSEFYFCGNSLDYCGTGCRSAFGLCGGSPSVSSSPAPPSSSSTRVPPTSTLTPSRTPTLTPTPTPTSSSTTPSGPRPTLPVSTNGQCGNGVTCLTSTYGQCCSSYGWCGNQDEYCRVSWGCQPDFGTCGTQSSLGEIAAM